LSFTFLRNTFVEKSNQEKIDTHQLEDKKENHFYVL